MIQLKKAAMPLMAALVLGGGAVASYATLASAQTADQASATPATTSTTDTHPDFDPTKGGHVGKNGTKEILLTGDDAAKATAAALVAVPGATVDRVETDAEGAAYEAHLTKSDGSHVTVKFDSAFTVTGTEDGPRGGHGPHTN